MALNSPEASRGIGREMSCIKSPKSQNVSADKITVVLDAHANFGFLVCRHAACTCGGAVMILDVALQSSSRSSA